MTAVVETAGLAKRYGRKWALQNCTLSIPPGKVIGLVGPNGAGKTTLLQLAVGLLEPTSGTISVLGGRPGDGPAQLERVGFVAQDTPTYGGLSVADHLRMGDYLNANWDHELADSRIAELDLDPRQKAGSLSGGQRAQLALTLAIAKRPELLLLDEPVASLDPLARREFLQSLMEVVALQGVSVVLSSHLVTDLERVCDYLVILVASHVQLAGEVSELLASHHRISGPRRDPRKLPANQEIIEESHTDKQSTFLVRTNEPILDPAWSVRQVTLDDLVLAYMTQARERGAGESIAPEGGVVIRFSWLQFRVQAVVAGVGLAVIAVVLAVTGPNLVHIYDTTVLSCAAHHDCSAATTALTDTDGPIQVFLAFLLLVIPVLIGMFWGAPLVAREFETGTFRLAWTQGVSRTRWLAGKLGLGALASLGVAGLLSLMVTWWSSPIDRVQADPYGSLVFGVRDIAPIGYAAFAFVLGVTAGLLVRRTLPAMLSAFVGFFAVREIVTRWVRPHLFAPLYKSLPITAAAPVGFDETPSGMKVVATTRGLLSNAWAYSNQVVDKAGHAPTQAFLDRACPFNTTTGQGNFQACTTNLAAKFHELVTYQPSSRYWGFQWYELAIFLGLAVILGAVGFWWIRRPLS